MIHIERQIIQTIRTKINEEQFGGTFKFDRAGERSELKQMIAITDNVGQTRFNGKEATRNSELKFNYSALVEEIIIKY